MTEDEFMERILEAKDQKDYVLAQELANDRLKAFPNCGSALRELALLHYRNNENFKAKEVIKQSLLYEDNFWGRLFYAMIFYRIKDYSAAEREYELAIERARMEPILPNYAEGIVCRYYADFLASQGRYATSKQRALDAMPFFLESPKDVEKLESIIQFCDDNID